MLTYKRRGNDVNFNGEGILWLIALIAMGVLFATDGAAGVGLVLVFRIFIGAMVD